ncbi:YhcN/YlaJ family sporulation lipoprotein [Bacillus sp. V3B]|uniref:YhcN/YlaJ family sporulation lipoprotein n=1 Tax=Bacillus sp. V3B TaxID=2804915 RepID=UPI00210CDF04|nr:YhcN/YlaJ family sporulation lipoprotein [Bacillus sp. V3B]MCQ6274966.1 YhcN/YlaJ family sporulation lipoprotein [Bacillus sp. V3B]
MRNKRVFFMILLMIFMTACANKEDGTDEKLSLMKKVDPEPMDVIYGQDGDDYRKDNPDDGLITEVENKVEKNEHLYDAIVVKSGKDILVAYKVKHLQRFKMKQIEKELKQQLKEGFPEYHFIVSSDYKIFLESMRLNKMLKDHDVSDKKSKEKFKSIIKLKEELT